MSAFVRPQRALALPIVARMFRGERVFLTAYSRADGALCCWSADQGKAHVFPNTAQALGAAAFAAVFWSADCGVIDGDGAVLQPAAAREMSAEPTGRAKAREFPRYSTAAVAAHAPHCSEHEGFTDGCSACYSVHRARSLS